MEIACEEFAILSKDARPHESYWARHVLSDITRSSSFSRVRSRDVDVDSRQRVVHSQRFCPRCLVVRATTLAQSLMCGLLSLAECNDAPPARGLLDVDMSWRPERVSRRPRWLCAASLDQNDSGPAQVVVGVVGARFEGARRCPPNSETEPDTHFRAIITVVARITMIYVWSAVWLRGR